MNVSSCVEDGGRVFQKEGRASTKARSEENWKGPLWGAEVRGDEAGVMGRAHRKAPSRGVTPLGFPFCERRIPEQPVLAPTSGTGLGQDPVPSSVKWISKVLASQACREESRT